MDDSGLSYNFTKDLFTTPPTLDSKERFFRDVYEEYRRPLGTFLYHLLGQKHEAEDLYQEVFEKFWKYLTAHKLPTREKTRKWLFTVARNKVIDHYRKQGRFSSKPLEEVEQTLPGPILTEDHMCQQEQLQGAFADMSPMYRICLVLQVIYGYSQKQIARQLNINQKTVSTNVSRGRKQLFRLLDDILLDDIRRKKVEETTHADASTK